MLTAVRIAQRDSVHIVHSGSGNRNQTCARAVLVTVGYSAGYMMRLLHRTCSPARRMAISRIIAILIMVSEQVVSRS
jgi:hypothetical protein